MTVNKRVLFFCFMGILSFISFQCLSEPENLLMFDRENTKPDNLTVETLDAFTVQLTWTIIEVDYVDQFTVYRAESDSPVLAGLEFTSVGVVFDSVFNSEDSEGTYSYDDTTAVYWKWNHYYVVSHYKGKSSFFSDTVSCDFKIDTPEVAVEIIDPNIIMHIYSAGNNYVDGIVTKRYSEIDTLCDTLSYTPASEKQITLNDSLVFDSSSSIEGFIGRTLYDYKDIKPNVDYYYSARNFQTKNDSTHYSEWNESNAIRLERDILEHSKTRAVSDSVVRIYLSNIDMNFDSVLIYEEIDNGNNGWMFFSSIHRDSLISYSYVEEYLWDIRYWGSLDTLAKIILVGNNSHSLPSNSIIVSDDTVTLRRLGIPGFDLVEEGIFSFGCNDTDDECEPDEFPVSSQVVPPFYLSTYEVTRPVLDDPNNWPPKKGDLPADSISWVDVISFCGDLNAAFPSYKFTLPSEAQWEYAAKHDLNGNDTKYPWGNDIDIYHANYGDANGGLVGVGQYPFPSSFSIYDMAGNVLEWVSNCYNDTLGLEPSDTTNCWKVARGGGYWHNPEDLRTTKRFHYPQDQSIEGIGFRVVMEVNQ